MNRKILSDFVEAINRADVETLYKVMTDDHLFIDAKGNCVEGRDAMNRDNNPFT